MDCTTVYTAGDGDLQVQNGERTRMKKKSCLVPVTSRVVWRADR